MTVNRSVGLVVASTILLAACEGDDGRDGVDGADGLNSLVATRDIPKGDADCPGGGLALDSGLDTDRNDVLDAGEVTATELLECETAPQLQALHASPDAPAVNILVNGAEALTDVDFGAGSGFLPVVESTQVQVEAIIPGGNAIVIDETLDLEFSTDYTVIATGDVGDPIFALVLSNPSGELITPGSFRAQVVHAAPDAPPVDVFVTTPGADLTASASVNASALSFQDSTARVEVAAGDYQIRVTLAGDPATVVFDSGTITLGADADLLIAAIENTGPGTTPIQLVVLDGTVSSPLLDTNTPATAVAVHASPDAPAVDILADDQATPANDALALAVDYAFTEFCEIPAVPAPTDYTLSVTPTGDPATVALSFDLSVVPAAEVTAIVSGLLTGMPGIQEIALENDTRAVITETKLRIVHGSPSTGNVDLYLLPDGTDLNDAATTPTVGNVPFTADTGIVSVAPGVYDVYVTPAGDKTTVAIEVQDLALAGGDVLDIIARDPRTDGSEGPLPQLIVIDYNALTVC